MSLITRCPACGTMFKVVPDQLRISEGWVRCGHCSEVFDATANLQPDAGSPTVPGDLESPMPPAAGIREPAESIPPDDPFPSSVTTEVGSGLPSGPLDSVQLREEAQALMEGPLDRPFVLQRVEEPAAAGEPPKPLPAAPAQAAREPDLHELSFVRAARRNEFWSSRPVRVLMALLLVALTALLAAQYALQDRDRLAATQPQLRPLLLWMCDHLGCTLGPPRQIESIAIDSSSFNKLRPDTYRLNVTLKNQAGIEVAMPSLEITLTDAQDQAVLRRVLRPGDFQPVRGVIAAGGDWSGSVALMVANGTAARVAGYRVLAFYP